MTKAVAKKKSAAMSGYADLLTDIKQRIRTAQVRTAMAGNARMLMLYWEIGGVLAERQKQEGWGAAVLPRLAADLQNDLPEAKGFSERNRNAWCSSSGSILHYSQLGHGPWPNWPNLCPKTQKGHHPWPILPDASPASKSGNGPLPNCLGAQCHPDSEGEAPSHPPLVCPIRRSSRLEPRCVSLQIQSRAHERHGRAIANFDRTLPPPQSDLAAQLLKDPYLFDFLILEKPFTSAFSRPGRSSICRIFSSSWVPDSPLWERRVHMEVGGPTSISFFCSPISTPLLRVVDRKSDRSRPNMPSKMNSISTPWTTASPRPRSPQHRPHSGPGHINRVTRPNVYHRLRGVPPQPVQRFGLPPHARSAEETLKWPCPA